MLGISARFKRKDDTDYVMRLFMGDILCSVERDLSVGQNVVVHGIKYCTTNPIYNETPTLVRAGKEDINRAAITTNICAFAPRTEFILGILQKFIARPPPVANCVKSAREEAFARKQFVLEMRASRSNCPCCANKCFPVELQCCGHRVCLDCVNNANNEAVSPGLNTKGKPLPPVAICPNPACKKRKRKVLRFRQLYVENPHVLPYTQKQTLVLAENLSILNYMYNKMVSQNLAHVGYYVGGMEREELDASAKCQVLLATYSMASEALDIKTLNGLVTATSRSDLLQSVGRILRKDVIDEHTIPPNIIDIRDSHDHLDNQWQTRKRTIYRKFGYFIRSVEMDDYLKESAQDDVRIPYFVQHLRPPAKTSNSCANDDNDDDGESKEAKKVESKKEANRKSLFAMAGVGNESP
jgi:hypothetical protein